MSFTQHCEEIRIKSTQSPVGVSFSIKNVINILNRETRIYELVTFRRQTHSFHISGQGSNIVPWAWDSRSFLVGISQGEPCRRDIRSTNQTRLARMELLVASIFCPEEPSLEIPWAERLWERCTDACTIVSSPKLILSCMCEGESEGTVDWLHGGKQIHFCLAILMSYGLHHLWRKPNKFFNVLFWLHYFICGFTSTLSNYNQHWNVV